MGSPPCAIFRYPDDLRNIVQQCARRGGVPTSYIFTFLESVPFDMYSETDFGSEKSIGSIIFRLKLKHESMYFWTAGWVGGGGVNIFLPVFKSLKFSLQYEILNLEVFLQINGANYALVVDNTNFHFQTSLNQF